MRNQPHAILQFELSPLAKAGLLIKSLREGDDDAEHAVHAPHRDNHYLLVLLTQGHLAFTIDFEEVSASAPALLLVFPSQVHYLLDKQDLQGWAISFDPILLDNGFHLVLENGWQGPVQLDPQSDFYRQAGALLDLLAQLQAGAPDAYTGRTNQALLAALLSRLAGKLLVAPEAPETKERRGTLIEQGFRQLLKRHYQSWKQPARYAAELAISVAHLNDTVKGITGTPVSTHIQHYAVLEAKRLLYFTDHSVKEIGYMVGYDEPVYFNKLFKKVTGMTPLHFRRKFRG